MANTVRWLVFNATFSTTRLYHAMQKVKFVNSFAAVGDYSRQDALSAVGDDSRRIYER